MGQQVSKKQEEVVVITPVYCVPDGPKYTILNPGASVSETILEMDNKKYKFVETSYNKYQLSEYK